MPPVIRGLIIANLAVYFLQYFAGQDFWQYFALWPSHVLKDFWIWQLATYLFLHGNMFHLFFNLFALWMFGLPVESGWGGREFLKYYFICGIGAGVLSVVLSPHPVIGASGAIFGILVAFAMMYPEATVYVYLIIPMTARTMAIVFGVITFFACLSSSRSGIAALAHLGGMLTGYVYLKHWWKARLTVKSWGKGFLSGGVKIQRPKRRRIYEPSRTEDLEEEVNRILDKVLVHGADSLTSQEKEVMKRYSEKTK